MLLAFVNRTRNEQDQLELCIVSEKSDLLTVPIRVFSLRAQDAAVYRAGPDETFTVNEDPNDGGLILSTSEPNALFLTQNHAVRPGMRVKRIKIVGTSEDNCQVYYDRDKGIWERWLANRERT
jgi:hypothetical protein